MTPAPSPLRQHPRPLNASASTQVEKARAAVLDRSPAEKEKMAQVWGKEPLCKSPLTMSVAYSSKVFNGEHCAALYTHIHAWHCCACIWLTE